MQNSWKNAIKYSDVVAPSVLCTSNIVLCLYRLLSHLVPNNCIRSKIIFHLKKLVSYGRFTLLYLNLSYLPKNLLLLS